MNHRPAEGIRLLCMFTLACLIALTGASCDNGGGSGPQTETDCSGGVDNDGDGLTDCDDPDCNGDPACPGDDEICDDTIDNDDDTLTDCDDPDCDGDPACPTDDEICDDDLDNDSDGDTDCDDPDCLGDAACQTTGEDVCDDNIDNDSDGATDCADTECAAEVHCLPETDCADEADNDMDGDTDCDDSDCADDAACQPVEVCDDQQDNDEDGDTDCDDDDCLGDAACQTTGEDVCDDNLDNDSDGATDCEDTECAAEAHCMPESICDDDTDNDMDGDTDCDDADCADDDACQPVEICDDQQDNDSDGDTDCDDDDCLGDAACQTTGEDVCDDSLDNDSDGATDCDDTECAAEVHCQPEVLCQDGVDNDLDELIDCADPDCAGVQGCPLDEFCDDGQDNDQDGDTDCDDDDCLGHPACQTTGEDVCDDGLDNDSDGATDCADTECAAEVYCHPETICDDQMDNDLDGLTDCEDEDCQMSPNCNPETDCANQVDDDLDSATDCDDSDCVLAPNCLVYCPDDQYEPNEDLASAMPIVPGSHSLYMCAASPGQEDWFSIDLAAGESLAVDVYFSHADVDIDLSLTNSADEPLDTSAGTTNEEHAYYTSIQAETVYIKVDPYNNGETAYDLHLTIDPDCTVPTESEDCPADQICQNFTCIPGCRNHLDCPDGEACVDNACIPGCRGDSECLTEEICEAGTCIAGCRGDSACQPGEICAGNICVIGCRLDNDCPDGEACVDNACIPGCRGDLECSAGEICADAICRAGCRIDSNCAAGELCHETLCITPACLNHSDCTPGQVCQGYECVQMPCDPAAGLCQEPGLVCDPTSSLCVECLTADDCPNTTDFSCSDSFCELSCAADPFEPNSLSNDAAALTSLPVSEPGLTLCGERDEDWFSLDLEADHIYQINLTFSDTAGDIDLQLFDMNDVRVASSASSTDDEEIVHLVETGEEGTYKVRVYLYPQDVFSQTYDLQIIDQGQIECYDDQDCTSDQFCQDMFCIDCPADTFEPNGDSASAAPVGVLPVHETGLTLCDQGAEDWFAINLTADTVYTFDILFNHAAGDLNMVLWAPGGTGPNDILESANSTTDDESILFLAPTSGTYRLEITMNYSVYQQTYDLHIEDLGQQECQLHLDCPNGQICEDYMCIDHTCDAGNTCPATLLCEPDALICVECLSVDDCPNPSDFSCQANRCENTCMEDHFEPNSDPASFAFLMPVTVETGLTLCGLHDEDWFALDMQQGNVYVIDLSFLSANGDIDLSLRNYSMVQVASSKDGVDGERIAYLVPEWEGGTYYFQVSLWSSDVYSHIYDMVVVDLGPPNCFDHLDCPNWHVCQDMQCYELVCDGNNPCPDGMMCDDTVNYCVQCLSADDCPSADYYSCQNNRCELNCVEDGFEDNDSLETAAAMGSAPVFENGLTLCGQNDEDWFAVDLEADLTYALDLIFASADGDIDLALYDSTGVELAHSWYGVDGEHIDFTVPSDGAGTYLVQVSLYTSSVYAHTYDLVFQAP